MEGDGSVLRKMFEDPIRNLVLAGRYKLSDHAFDRSIERNILPEDIELSAKVGKFVFIGCDLGKRNDDTYAYVACSHEGLRRTFIVEFAVSKYIDFMEVVTLMWPEEMQKGKRGAEA